MQTSNSLFGNYFFVAINTKSKNKVDYLGALGTDLLELSARTERKKS